MCVSVCAPDFPSSLLGGAAIPIVGVDGLGSPGKGHDVISQGGLRRRPQSKQTGGRRRYRREGWKLAVNLFLGTGDRRGGGDPAFPTAGRGAPRGRRGRTGCCEEPGPGGGTTRLRSGCQLEDKKEAHVKAAEASAQSHLIPSAEISH